MKLDILYQFCKNWNFKYRATTSTAWWGMDGETVGDPMFEIAINKWAFGEEVGWCWWRLISMYWHIFMYSTQTDGS